MAGNTFSVTMRDGDKLEKRLKKLKTGCETAITRTVSDFRTRAPGWVNKGIRQHYGVDQAGVKSASVRIKNTASGTNALSGVSIEYKGRVLTLTHFNYSPHARPATRRYTIKATIIKGQKTELNNRSFIAKGLPYQRLGSARKPVEVIKTLSVPQMISDRAKDTIDGLIKENMEKRFKHNIEQIMK